MLKSLLPIIFLVFSQYLSAQVITGTYVSSQDTTSVFTDSLHIQFVSYPNLRLNKDQTFSYNWNLSHKCMMGSTKGRWGVVNDTLSLQDMQYSTSGPGYSQTREAQGMLIVNAYKIEGRNLTYLYTIHETESQKSYQPSQPSFRFYKE